MFLSLRIWFISFSELIFGVDISQTLPPEKSIDDLKPHLKIEKREIQINVSEKNKKNGLNFMMFILFNVLLPAGEHS